MNLRELKYVIAVAETRHFGKAAERCFVSQPTLSGQIKKLEEELGIAIFERTNRSVEITPAGRAILGHARQLMEQADAIEQLARAHQDPLAGPLRIGAIPTISPYLMPLVLVPLKQRYPQIKLVLSEEVTDTLLQRLRNHEIDAALLATPVEEHDLDAMPLFNEPFRLALPRRHPLCNKQGITRRDLNKLELLLLAEGHCLAKQAMEVCRIKERSDRGEMADLRAASLETLLQLVAGGFGSTLVPVLALRKSWITDAGISVCPLDLPDAYRTVALVFRSSFPRRPALDALAGMIRESLPDTVEIIDRGQQRKRKTKS